MLFLNHKQTSPSFVTLLRKYNEGDFITVNRTRFFGMVGDFASNITNDINGLMNNLLVPDFDIKSFDKDIVLRIARSIQQSGSSLGNIDTVSNTLDYYLNTLNTVQKLISLYEDNRDCKAQKEKLKEYETILNNINKLSERINELRKQLKMIPDQNISMTVVPEIKKEYLEYILKYGYPEDGIFDLRLLELE